MEGVGNANYGCVLAKYGQVSARIPYDHLRYHRMAVNGRNRVFAVLLIRFARADAELGQFEDAWRCIGEAMTAAQTTRETWRGADTYRMAGEITLISLEPDTAKAQGYFERALSVARSQQAKSWELRAATSLARLWRDQRKRKEARELLAPVHGWFTEGFDTRDLKEAKALLDELAL